MSDFERGQIHMAQEIVEWVRREHEHHGTRDEEWFTKIFMEVPEGEEDPPYPGCEDGGFPYVNSLSLERYLLFRKKQLSFKANRGG